MKVLHLFSIFILLFFFSSAKATEFNFSDSANIHIIGKYTEIFTDSTGKLTFDQVRRQPFHPSTQDVPNFGISKSANWIKVSIRNNTSHSGMYLSILYPSIDKIEFYSLNADSTFTRQITGEEQPVNERAFLSQHFIFDEDIAPGTSKLYYIRLQSTEQVLMPLTVGSYEATSASLNEQDILTGIYFGIMLVMILYNFFVYLSVKDRSYIVYVFYILFVALTQLGLQGYSYRYFWPGSPYIANQSIIFFPAITGIVAIEFFKQFLQVKKRRSLLILNILNALYIVDCVLSVAGQHMLSQQILQPTALIASVVIIYISVSAIRRGNRSAIFFLIAWISFLAGIIIYILKDVGVLPYNNFTNYILFIGSAIEVILLSFALADKINTYRKEKEESQAKALAALQENDRIIREQNVMLEVKVEERTSELKVANEDLNVAMKELKEAETQLVESEKMSSLGQLTAGIAHEINNPINFVTSNIKPLNRDVQMLLETVAELERISVSEDSIAEKKQQITDFKNEIDFDYLKVEIDQLLSGIGEGASRTAEIVKGLRIFSRLDEDDLKRADINDGLESTLVITNNLLNGIIKVQKKYGNLPLVECYPGKLNQVFLNIISNAIYAIKKKFGDKEGGLLIIETSYDEQHIFIKLKDNGTGMDEQTKRRLFEPFFTTKDVGEGTGLGMSIAYNTIVKHNGQIIINSEPGEGAEFILELPLIQK